MLRAGVQTVVPLPAAGEPTIPCDPQAMFEHPPLEHYQKQVNAPSAFQVVLDAGYGDVRLLRQITLSHRRSSEDIPLPAPVRPSFIAEGSSDATGGGLPSREVKESGTM